MVAPARERGLKSEFVGSSLKPGIGVAPARERGLKFKLGFVTMNGAKGRSREGAWIEITS